MAKETGGVVRKGFALGVFAATLSLTLWWNETLIYPVEAIASFAVLLTVSATALLLRTAAAVPFCFTMRIFSVPVGLYVSLVINPGDGTGSRVYRNFFGHDYGRSTVCLLYESADYG